MSQEMKARVFVSAVCHDGKGHIMMAKRGGQARDRHGEWEFGGGAVEEGEQFEAALRRETTEELGVVLTEVNLLHAHQFVRESGNWIGLFYLAQVNPSEVFIAEPVYDEIAWFAPDDIPKQTFEIATELAQKAKVALRI